MFGAWLPRAGVLTLGLVVAGCSSGQATLSKTTVEQGAKDALTQSVGQTPKSVTCTNDLEAKVGATERCTLTADDGSSIGMTVTVTSVDNGTAHFDVKVDSVSPSAS